MPVPARVTRITQDPEVWRPKALAFLRANGYLEPKANPQEAK